jgi:hypothetical protein
MSHSDHRLFLAAASSTIYESLKSRETSFFTNTPNFGLEYFNTLNRYLLGPEYVVKLIDLLLIDSMEFSQAPWRYATPLYVDRYVKKRPKMTDTELNQIEALLVLYYFIEHQRLSHPNHRWTRLTAESLIPSLFNYRSLEKLAVSNEDQLLVPVYKYFLLLTLRTFLTEPNVNLTVKEMNKPFKAASPFLQDYSGPLVKALGRAAKSLKEKYLPLTDVLTPERQRRLTEAISEDMNQASLEIQAYWKVNPKLPKRLKELLSPQLTCTKVLR